ncbi:MAG: hypothetical protein V4592_22535 [Bacteroidota bacterium]
MPSDKNIIKFILAVLGLFTLIMGVLIFIHPTAIYPDPSMGFQVLRSMRMGAPFNVLVSPDTADIAQNTDRFLSWWSPGQYLVPYLFVGLFKLNLGQATAVVSTLGSVIGLAGLYVFFKKIGFTPLISAISIAFIASQQAYFIPFVFYNGGEVLVFAFSGWFLYGCACFTKPSWQMFVFLLSSGVIGFFCKSAFLWIFLSGALYLWIQLSNGKKLISWIINGISIGIPFILSLGIIYIAYLSKGDNPASDAMGIKLAWETFSFPLASPLLAAFSIDDITNGIINQPIGILILLALLSLGLVIYCFKSIPNNNYTLLLGILYGVAVLFYGANFLRQANISYEARHMRLMGLIITPAIIYLLSRIKPMYWTVLAVMWLFILNKNYKFTTGEYHRNASQASHGSTGLAQIFIDQPTLNYITQLDKQQSNAIFVFTSADIGLEINHGRIIIVPEIDGALQPDRPLDNYPGHDGPVYIVLPKACMGAKADMYMKEFPGYTNFVLHQPGKDYVVYAAQ